MTDDLIHEQDDRRTEPLGIVHSHDRRIVCLTHAPRCQCDHGMVAMGAPAGLHDIALARGGRLAGRRTYALHIDEHAGDLGTGSIADELLLQGETRAARRIHGLHARQRSAQNRAHTRDLVLHLHELAAHTRQQFRHRLGDFGRRGDRITSKETYSGRDCALSACFVSLHQSGLAHCAASFAVPPSDSLSTKIA